MLIYRVAPPQMGQQGPRFTSPPVVSAPLGLMQSAGGAPMMMSRGTVGLAITGGAPAMMAHAGAPLPMMTATMPRALIQQQSSQV